MNDNFTDRFWSAIEQLENLNSDEVLSLIEENQNRTVSFPENMLLKHILERDSKAGLLKAEEKDELEKKHLLAERYEKGDFFIADGSDSLLMVKSCWNGLRLSIFTDQRPLLS